MSKEIRLSLLILFFLFSFFKHDVIGQDLEKKIDKFYTDLVVGLKEAKNEKNDPLAIEKMKKLKVAFLPRAEQLQVEIDKHFNTMTDEQILEWDDKFKSKNYNKEIFDLTFDISFVERLNKNSDFENAYNDIIDLSDKVIAIEFAEPVDPLSVCTFTLNGGKFNDHTFSLPPSGMKTAEAFSEEGALAFDIEGYSGKNLLGLSFVTSEEKIATYKWEGDFGLTLTYFDGAQEIVMGGHEGKGKIILDTVEDLGGWVAGKFEGKLETEDTKEIIDVKGSFKIRRNIGSE